jgi:hypothetical protein
MANPAELNTVTVSGTRVRWKGDKESDIRAKLFVPKAYTQGLGGGPDASGVGNDKRPFQFIGGPPSHPGGIIFPYTPTVSSNNQAVYTSLSPTHSNYPSQFYKNSTVGPISVSGKFTCQNEYEASLILGYQHLLRMLTKMKWGNDIDAGSPPPVCRFSAYGNSMYSNVPVQVQSWKMELPSEVDYISVGAGIKDYGNNFVPVSLTITLDLIVVYSRAQQLGYSVDAFSKGTLADQGYL